MAPTGIPAIFLPYRPGAPFGSSLRYRDAEYMWDGLYGTGLSQAVRTTLDRYSRALVETTGTSPVAVDAHNTQVVYDYLNREGRTWSEVPTDLFGGLRIGDRNYPAADYSHVDAYITDWEHDRAGRYPASWETADEDSTSGHARGDVLHLNSIHFGGPPRSSPYDTLGTGWTAPRSLAFTGFNHEMAHSFVTTQGPPVGGGMQGELWSAGAEAVGGIGSVDNSEVPYTWSLMAWCDPASCYVPHSIDDPAFDNRFSLSNYQARTAFMCYLAYNFLNADTNRTLAGMTDDLMYKWLRSGNSSPGGIANVLSDAACPTCAQKNYFRRSGAPMSAVERLAVLHHNFRVGNLVNNPDLDEKQYGYPAWGGFSPTVNQRSWRAVDGTTKTDIVAIPAIVNLAPTSSHHDTTLQGTRTFRGMSHPMALVPYGANYWVVRPTGSLTTTDQDLVIRITPRAFYLQCSALGTGDFGVRLMASAVAYDRADGGGDESDLWQFPSDAVYSTAVEWTMADSAAEDIRLVVPSFGVTHKAVVVVITLADGRTPSWAWTSYIPYEEAMPYRLDIGVANTAGLSQAPFELSATLPGSADWPSWNPTSDEVAYSDRDPSISTYSQIYRRKLDGSQAQRVFAQAANQYNPDWSPLGNRVVWSNYSNAPVQIDLWMADVTTPNGPAWQLTNVPGASTLAAFQPNGQGIAYVLQRAAPADTAWEIRWVGVDGTGDRLLASFSNPAPNTAPLLPIAPRWTRDGAHVVVCDYATRRFYRCPVTGGPPLLVSGPALDFVSFDLPPGSGRIAVTSTAPLLNAAPLVPSCGLHPVVTSSTSGRVALIDTVTATRDTSYRFVAPGIEARNLRWSPDGTRIAYSRWRTGTSDRDVWVGRTTWNRAPVMSASVQASYSVPDCVPFELPLSATDPEGDPLTFEAAFLPAGALFQSGNTIYWPYPQPGQYWLVARALDPSGGVASKVVRLDVYDETYCGGEGGEDPDPILGGPNAIRQADSNRLIGGGAGPMRVANTFLDGAPIGQPVAQTARLMAARSDESGDVATRFVALRSGSLRLDRVRLVAVDHAPGTVAASTGTGVVAGPVVRAARLTADANEDLSASLTGAEGDARLFAAGTTLEVEWPQGEPVAGLLIGCARASAADPAAEWGVRVEVPDAAGWRPVAHVHPRSGYDVLAASVGETPRLRLVFASDTYVREVAGYGSDAGEPATVTVVSLSSTDAEEGVERLATPDENSVELTQGQKLTLRFSGPVPDENRQRTLFLDLVASVVRDGAGASSAGRTNGPAPMRYALHGNRPNPFGSGTSIHFDAPRAGHVRVEVFDAQGRRVRTLADGEFAPGTHLLEWDGTDSGGQRVRPGVYLYRMWAEGFRDQRRMVLLAR